jgi:hypothetical protein
MTVAHNPELATAPATRSLSVSVTLARKAAPSFG